MTVSMTGGRETAEVVREIERGKSDLPVELTTRYDVRRKNRFRRTGNIFYPFTKPPDDRTLRTTDGPAQGVR